MITEQPAARIEQRDLEAGIVIEPIAVEHVLNPHHGFFSTGITSESDASSVNPDHPAALHAREKYRLYCCSILMIALSGASSTVTTCLGANFLVYNLDKAAQAGSVGGAVIMALGLLLRSLNPEKPGTSVYLLLLIGSCLASGVVGQLILHGGSDDDISLNQLAQASALGVGFFVALFALPVLCGACGDILRTACNPGQHDLN